MCVCVCAVLVLPDEVETVLFCLVKRGGNLPRHWHFNCCIVCRNVVFFISGTSTRRKSWCWDPDTCSKQTFSQIAASWCIFVLFWSVGNKPTCWGVLLGHPWRNSASPLQPKQSGNVRAERSSNHGDSSGWLNGGGGVFNENVFKLLCSFSWDINKYSNNICFFGFPLMGRYIKIKRWVLVLADLPGQETEERNFLSDTWC